MTDLSTDEEPTDDLPGDREPIPEQPADRAKAPPRAASASARPKGPPPSRGVMAKIIFVACAYELLAEGLNTVLEEPVLPSIITAIQRFRARTVVAKLTPESTRVAATLGAGYGVGVVMRAASRSKD